MFVKMDEYKGLFKDDNAYQAMLNVFTAAFSKSNTPLVFVGKEVLFTAVSPEGTKQMLTDRILKRISEHPELIDEVKDRLEHDAIVE
jgi:hypothetical protein